MLSHLPAFRNHHFAPILPCHSPLRRDDRWLHESDKSASRRLTVHSQEQIQPLAPEILDDQKQSHEGHATEHREKQRVGPCERLLDAFLFVLCVLAQEGFGV